MKKIWFLITAVFCIVVSAIGIFALDIISKSVPPTEPYITTKSEEEAKAIVLEKAGLTADKVVFDRVEIDNENGIYQYEVEFKSGYIEYDASISALDGAILSWEVDYDY